ncbi:zinc-dependent peptidase [Tamlana sp. 62-3]|uniref:Zinc-dependent peptidase n=1 Tax=Neotamlana sargassicola TaxID=2883125 RepID=A0A9X1I697_9FLAO|nr:zinc-dependent peptidase [Tamlana sargassicola]MCB4808093.1 zinc-dependent peptidase [Tamlana sargassicola]
MDLEKLNIGVIILIFFIAFLLFKIFSFSFKLLETAYVIKFRKPFYNHLYLRLKRLKPEEKLILKNNFSFYKRLNKKEQRYFEHRLHKFLDEKDFVGRDDLIITTEMRVLISATAVMLTFGFRDFYIDIISRIVVYPKIFYSTSNKTYNKGEFNPRLKSLVLSWEDFKKGYAVNNDNLNLGIHEFTHAIQINSLKSRDVSSVIFTDSFSELSKLLNTNQHLKNKLMASNYFRKYAFTNQFEFLAVAIETFIETPGAFKSQFPEVYYKIKQMLNFNIAGY